MLNLAKGRVIEMMVKLSPMSVLVVLAVCSSGVCAVQPFEEDWNMTFGDVSGWSISEAIDYGYIIVGSSDSSTNDNDDIYLLKTDSDGKKEWDKIFGTNYDECGYLIQATKDRGYFIAGRMYEFLLNDAWLIKTNSSGYMEWNKMYDAFDPPWNGEFVSETTDGGFIMVGDTLPTSEKGDIVLTKTDSKGNEEWVKIFSVSGDAGGNSIKITNDGGYVILGSTDMGGHFDDILLIKTDERGNVEWTKTLGSILVDDRGISVQQTTDGGYVVVGFTGNYGNFDVYLAKTSSNGDLDWYRTFGGSENDWGYSVQECDDGGYIVLGQTKSYGSGEGDIYLIKTDSNGIMEWNQTIGGPLQDEGHKILKTSDGGYIILGYTESYGLDSGALWLIKLRTM
jgi:hypothetical protein